MLGFVRDEFAVVATPKPRIRAGGKGGQYSSASVIVRIRVVFVGSAGVFPSLSHVRIAVVDLPETPLLTDFRCL